MSSNNFTLVKKHKGKYLIFANVFAESWDKENILNESEAISVHDNLGDAMKEAIVIDEYGQTEYGVRLDFLPKDGAKVIIK